MLISRIVKENLEIDSKAFNDLSPKMKDAVSDVFKLVEKSTGDIIKRFEGACDNWSIKFFVLSFTSAIIYSLFHIGSLWGRTIN